MKTWLNHDLRIFITSYETPTLVQADVTHIEFGKHGSVWAECSMPMGRGLYFTPNEDVALEVVQGKCCRPDDYNAGTPVVRVQGATATKWIDLENEELEAVKLQVEWRGHVVLLNEDEA